MLRKFIAFVVTIAVTVEVTIATDAASPVFPRVLMTAGVEPTSADLSVVRQQKEWEEAFLAEYRSGAYTMEEPYVIVDPYRYNSLSALALFSTPEECRISVSVGKDEPIIADFQDYSTEHAIPILGLFYNTETEVTLTATMRSGEIRQTTVMIGTDPVLELNDAYFGTASTPVINENGSGFLYLCFDPLGVAGFDRKGNVRYFAAPNKFMHQYRYLPNGNFITGVQYTNCIYELNSLGKIVTLYLLPQITHHELIVLDNGNYLISLYDPNTRFAQDTVIELDPKSGQIVYELDVKESVLRADGGVSFVEPNIYEPYQLLRMSPGLVEDWLHTNSLFYDKNNDLLILSNRHKGVFAIRKESKELIWILAPPDLWNGRCASVRLRPKDTQSEYPFGQHAAFINSRGFLTMFDNGLYRKDAAGAYIPYHKNYSRVVEYAIDPEEMTFEQIAQFGERFGSDILSESRGNVEEFDDGSRLICFASLVTDIMGTPVSEALMQRDFLRFDSVIMEIDCDDRVVQRLDLTGKKQTLYRSVKFNPYAGLFNSAFGDDVPVFAANTIANQDLEGALYAISTRSGFGAKCYLTIANESDAHLDSQYMMHHRILSLDGKEYVGWTPMFPLDIAPGSSVRYETLVWNIPVSRERVVIEFDIMHGKIGWRKDGGMEPVRVIADVQQ